MGQLLTMVVLLYMCVTISSMIKQPKVATKPTESFTHDNKIDLPTFTQITWLHGDKFILNSSGPYNKNDF